MYVGKECVAGVSCVTCTVCCWGICVFIGVGHEYIYIEGYVEVCIVYCVSIPGSSEAGTAVPEERLAERQRRLTQFRVG